MAATILHSFSELAKLLGNDKVKAKKVATSASYTNIEAKCGRKAAMIWAFLQEQESCKRYGPAGFILQNTDTLKAETGYDDTIIFASVLSLTRNGFARLTPNGQYVRAA